MNNDRAPFHLGHNSALDGLRGIAILFVLLEHGDVVRSAFGFIGVNTFFVLSGFLITSLLISEWDKTGGLDLKSFYIRRVLRLFPALLSMLGIFALYVVLTESGRDLRQHLSEALWALLYVTNWVRALKLGPTSFLGHTWSLSIEEQFYLLWPCALLWALKKTSRQSLVTWLLLAIAGSFGIRCFLQWADALIPFNSPTRLTDGLDTRADSLLIGCLIGVLVSSNLLTDPRIKTLLYRLSLGPGIALLFLCFNKHLASWMVYLGWLLASVLAAVLILQALMTRDTLLTRCLQNRVLVFIGRISYGLYLWHFPILGAMQKHHLPWQHLVYLVPSFIVAIGSYYLLELPFLKLKSRYQRAA